MRNILSNGLVHLSAAVLLLVMGTAVACGGDAAATVSPAPTVPPVDQPSPALTAEEQTALDYLATELGVDPGDISHIDTEYNDWPDGSMGCPEPDTAYIQVITPGYKYIFSHLEEHHAVHAGIDGRGMVYCK